MPKADLEGLYSRIHHDRTLARLETTNTLHRLITRLNARASNHSLPLTDSFAIKVSARGRYKESRFLMRLLRYSNSSATISRLLLMRKMLALWLEP
jgi:hypothetical protein